MNDVELWAIERNYDDDCDNEWVVCKNGETEFVGRFEDMTNILANHLHLHPFDVASYRLRCLQTDQTVPGELFAY